MHRIVDGRRVFRRVAFPVDLPELETAVLSVDRLGYAPSRTAIASGIIAGPMDASRRSFDTPSRD